MLRHRIVIVYTKFSGELTFENIYLSTRTHVYT